MGVLVWGFGEYYRKKQKSIPREEMIAFVSGKETGAYEGLPVIRPEDILQCCHDRLYIMAGAKAVFEILNELRELGYQSWDKVVFGWSVEPYIDDEATLLEEGKIVCNSRGICEYAAPGQSIELKSEQDWNQFRKRRVREKRKNTIAHIPLQPVSNAFGTDRGTPIDRYYIEKFLRENTRHIKGTVMEVAERQYTIKYGSDVKKSYIMHVSDRIDKDCIIANLETGEGVTEGLADCFILTQTLPFIFDVKSAAQNVLRFLKRGGVALVTVSGITQISRYDMDRWGHYWSFTTASLQQLFEICNDTESVEIRTYGNVKSAASGLYGLAVEEMNEKDLLYCDEDYQQVITAVVRKIM